MNQNLDENNYLLIKNNLAKPINELKLTDIGARRNTIQRFSQATQAIHYNTNAYGEIKFSSTKKAKVIFYCYLP
jgi:hypothetical protein